MKTDMFQKDLDRLGEWAVENVMQINPSKSKGVCFTRARVKDPISYLLMGTLIPEVSSCKYLGIILHSDLSWADEVNNMVKKAWKALHFTMRILKMGNSNTKSLAYMSLVHPILECGAAYWDPYREGQIIAIDKLQKKAAKFAYHTNSSNGETSPLCRKLSRICALFKAYSGEQAWKAIGDRLQLPHYLSSGDNEHKIRSRRQRTDIEKYSFVHRTIHYWIQIPAEVLGTLPCKLNTLQKGQGKQLLR